MKKDSSQLTPAVWDAIGSAVRSCCRSRFSGTVTDLGGGRFRYRPNGRAEQGFVDHFAIIADGHGGVVTKTVALIV